MPKNPRNRYAPPRTRPAATFVAPPGVFGVVSTDGGWLWWAAWHDGHDHVACSARDPDGVGWVFGGDLVGRLFEGALSKLAGEDPNPAARAALEWLAAGGTTRALRDDSLAADAYGAMLPRSPGGPAQVDGGPRRHSAQPHHQPPWWVAELGCSWPTNRADVEAAYRLRARSTHPDQPGGSSAAFARVQRARECAIGWCAEREGSEG